MEAPFVTILHPSLGRPQKALDAYHKWIVRMGLNRCEYILSLDKSDPHLFEYESLFSKNYILGGFSLLVYDNKSVVDATNNAARHSTGNILIYVSDDFEPCENWGPLVMKEFEGVEGPLLLKVDDCLQPFHVPVLTIPIMNRALYERLGYFFHPEYKSMFCDQDLFEVCNKNRWIKNAPHLKFPHNHVSVGKAQDDETYRRSASNWDQGKALFARRKAQGFPI